MSARTFVKGSILAAAMCALAPTALGQHAAPAAPAAAAPKAPAAPAAAAPAATAKAPAAAPAAPAAAAPKAPAAPAVAAPKAPAAAAAPAVAAPKAPAAAAAPAVAAPKAPTAAAAPAVAAPKAPAAPAVAAPAGAAPKAPAAAAPAGAAPKAPAAAAAAPAAVAPKAAEPAAPVVVAKALPIDTTHSRIGFTASTVLFDVDGKFDKYEVMLEGEPTALPKAKVKVTIDAASIDTDNEKRDEHLRSADFFDAKQFPKLVFTSTKIVQRGAEVIVSGVLAMHGKEKPVTIKFKRAQGKNGAGVDATTLRGKLAIKRSDFGIGADSIAAKISLEDEVTLDLLLVALN